MAELSHLDASGRAVMVDVGAKPVSHRYARARGAVTMSPATLEKISRGSFSKGDVFGVARLAGISAAKKTGDLIPLCHPLPLDWVGVELLPLAPDKVVILGQAAAQGRTGIEMEALTAVSVSALALYDMCKAVDRNMEIAGISLLEKRGGRSGHFYDESRCLSLPPTDSAMSLSLGSLVDFNLSEDVCRVVFGGALVWDFEGLAPVFHGSEHPPCWFSLGEAILEFDRQDKDAYTYKVWRPGSFHDRDLLIRLD